MKDKELREIENFERSKYNPAQKVLKNIKWWHIVLVAGLIFLIIYFMYQDVESKKLDLNETQIVINSISKFNTNSTQNQAIEKKIVNAGKLDLNSIIIFLVIIVALIIWLTLAGPQIELDAKMVILIAEKSMEDLIGVGRMFPSGTTYKIKMVVPLFQGTMPITAMVCYKWLVQVEVTQRSVPKYYVLEIRHSDGRFIGIKDQPKDFDREFRDTKYAMPRDASITFSKKYGPSLAFLADLWNS